VECSVIKEGQYSVIYLSGEIDMYCSADARKTILSELSGSNSVLIDLSAVQYIDSSAIASLVEGYQMAKHARLSFILVSVSDAVMQVFKLARLDKVFDIQSSTKSVIEK
jgi:anti-sigma B factor antagonist